MNMLTVTISINCMSIYARSCRNQLEVNDEGETKYITDTGAVIWHNREDGAVALAEKLLKTINEDMR